VWGSGSWRSAAVLALAVAAGLAVRAQAPGRIATTAPALLAEPVFFTGRLVTLRGSIVQGGAAPRLATGDPARDTGQPVSHPIFVYWRETPARADGEIRGQFYDLGRVRDDDSRLTGYDFRPMLEQVNNGRWPARDEIYVLLNATIEDAPPATAPSIRAIALEPQRFDDRAVTVTGRFRGRNLYGDLPNAPNRSKYDFVIQSADAALWVTGLQPKTRTFNLDPGARVDTGRWVEISGRVHVEGPAVWIEGESIREGRQPSDEDAIAPPPAITMPAPEVVFSAPVADETGVSTTTSVRIQFSRDMTPASFKDQVRVSYVTAPGAEAPPAPPAQTLAYRIAPRALEITFAAPLAPFQTVKVELLGGIKAADGQALGPWSLTFTTGG
jgi:hypothetical protein